MSNLFRKYKRKSEIPADQKYCLQANSDQMLFFNTRDEMMSYLKEYEKKIPVYNLSMFCVKFFQII